MPLFWKDKLDQDLKSAQDRKSGVGWVIQRFSESVWWKKTQTSLPDPIPSQPSTPRSAPNVDDINIKLQDSKPSVNTNLEDSGFDFNVDETSKQNQLFTQDDLPLVRELLDEWFTIDEIREARRGQLGIDDNLDIDNESKEWLKGFVSESWDALRERWKNISDIGNRIDSRSGNISQAIQDGWLSDWLKQSFKNQANTFWGAFQTVGQLVAAWWDVLFEGLENLIQDGTTQWVEDAIQSSIANIGDTEVVKDIAKSYGDFKKRNPESARNIEATFNIAGILPVFKGGKLVTDGVDSAGESIKWAGKIIWDSANNLDVGKSNEIARNFVSPIQNKKNIQEGIRQWRLIEWNTRDQIELTKFDESVIDEVSGVLQKNSNPTRVPKIVSALRDEIKSVDGDIKKSLWKFNQPFNKKTLSSFLKNTTDDVRLDTLFTDKQIQNQYNNLVSKFVERLESNNKLNNLGLFEARQEFDQLLKESGIFEWRETSGKLVAKSFRSKINDFIDQRLPDNAIDLKESLSKEHKLFTGLDNLAERVAPNFNKSLVDKIRSQARKFPILSNLWSVAGTAGLIGISLSGYLTPVAITSMALYGSYKIGKNIVESKQVRSMLSKVLEVSGDVLTSAEKKSIQDSIDLLSTPAVFWGIRELDWQ